MKSILDEHRRRVDALLTEAGAARERHRAEKAELAAAKARLAAVKEARALAQAAAQAVQEAAHAQVADIVTRSLAAVFPDSPYEFQIRFEAKRGRTEAKLVFVRDGLEVDPVSAAGGGVVDVASLALRLSALLLSRPPCRRLVVLDEPLKHLSGEYRPAAKRLIETLAAELDFQFVIVTHSAGLRAGKVVEL